MTAGIDILKWLHDEQLQIDPEWSVRGEEGFTWWPHRFAQRIEIADSKETEDSGHLDLVRVSTDVLEDVNLKEEGLRRLNALALPFASLAAFFHDGETRTLQLVSSAWVHEGNRGWIEPILSVAATLQLHEAEGHASGLARFLDGKAHHSGHPESGLRESPDEITGIIEKLVLPLGSGPSSWEDAEFADTCERYMQQPPCLLANAGGSGFTAEFPWGEVSSLLQVTAGDSHPSYGSGLLLRQRFPFSAEGEAELVRVALDLNEADVSRGAADAYGFGSYCVDGGDLVFVAFYPNAAHRVGVLPNLYFTSAARARFVSSIFLEDDWSNAWDEEGNCWAKSSVERMMDYF
ncbi:hypothetical protein N9X25_04455 [Verrucomicrobiales bacterium]|nr:hypothetical protein [Verrucomicrobiales bacterium]